MDGLAAAAVSL
uniref:Uncharacterized protein n=1 Tax=Arundo donax TaxID=35708 RepID=A0A0A9ACC3_ARUDO